MTFVQEAIIDAAGSPQVSDAFEVPGALRFGMQIVPAGASGWTAALQGSIDGANWEDLEVASDSTFVGYGKTNADDLVVRYIRVDLRGVAGGTVTAHVVAV